MEPDLPTVLRRIEERLKALNLNAHKASKLAKVPDAIRNMQRAVREGRRGVNFKTVAALAPVLETTSAALMAPSEAIEPGHDDDQLELLKQERARVLEHLAHIEYAIAFLEKPITKKYR